MNNLETGWTSEQPTWLSIEISKQRDGDSLIAVLHQDYWQFLLLSVIFLLTTSLFLSVLVMKLVLHLFIIESFENLKTKCSMQGLSLVFGLSKSMCGYVILTMLLGCTMGCDVGTSCFWLYIYASIDTLY